MLVFGSNVLCILKCKACITFSLNYFCSYTCSKRSDMRQYVILCFQVLGCSEYFRFLPSDTLTNIKYAHRSSSEKALTSSFTLNSSSHSVSYHMCGQKIKVVFVE